METPNCLKPCSGLLVTSFYKSEQKRKFDDISRISGAYDNYKKISEYPYGYTGIIQKWK